MTPIDSDWVDGIVLERYLQPQDPGDGSTGFGDPDGFLVVFFEAVADEFRATARLLLTRLDDDWLPQFLTGAVACLISFLVPDVNWICAGLGGAVAFQLCELWRPWLARGGYLGPPGRLPPAPPAFRPTGPPPEPPPGYVGFLANPRPPDSGEPADPTGTIWL